MNKYKKILYLLLLVILSITIFVPVICKVQNSISKIFNKNNYYIIDNIFDIYIIFITNIKIIINWFLIQTILGLFGYCIYSTIFKSKIKSKGIQFKSEDGTFGTANWMSHEDLEDSFEVGTEDGIIVGKLNDKIVTLPNNTFKNKNVAVFGASGSKKSRRICYSQYT